MSSVTQRIKQIKQPRGGYLPPAQFSVTPLSDGRELYPAENLHASTVGLAVDYLTRCASGTDPQTAFQISIAGAKLIGEESRARALAGKVKGLDKASIDAACKLSGYDVCFRAGPAWYRPVEEIRPDADTTENIRILADRSLAFFRQYGPVVKDGLTFKGGYTDLITSGDGDFLTADTLWDFKVSSAKPTKDHTLQLLIYYLMGIHSIHPEYECIRRLGLYNPRLNLVYLKEISQIPDDVIRTVSAEVIGYK
ncbi:MAG TPA: hypothetical protein H9668_00700 [Firmicutes bacterium]|nr:hypothetical protein [Bacillota bacterium]